MEECRTCSCSFFSHYRSFSPFAASISYILMDAAQFSCCSFNKKCLIGHFTVMNGNEANGDLVLIQTFLLYYVNQVILMLTSIFQGQFP